MIPQGIKLEKVAFPEGKAGGKNKGTRIDIFRGLLIWMKTQGK